MVKLIGKIIGIMLVFFALTNQLVMHNERNNKDIQAMKAEAASNKFKTYEVTPTSEPLDKKVKNYKNYNKYTKVFYMLQTYLDAFEKQGGGTLVFKKGTYPLSKSLYVPSNVTVLLKDGVILSKTNTTGSKNLAPSKAVIVLANYSNLHKVGVVGKYNGVKNVKILGEGTVTINLNNIYESIGIAAGHNQNIVIDNIQFKNMYSGHFIEMTATKNASITNSTFIGSKSSPKTNKEAINIDTPDRATKGFNYVWSKQDGTPNDNVRIENNRFASLDRAIGTHKYTTKRYHTHIVLRNNKIENTRSDAIRVMNWDKPKIEKNTIRNVSKSSNLRGILFSGVKNPIVINNTFYDIPRAMQFMPIKNNGDGSHYPATYNTLNTNDKNKLKQNTYEKIAENFIRINSKLNVFDKYTEKIAITVN